MIITVRRLCVGTVVSVTMMEHENGGVKVISAVHEAALR